MPARSVKSFDMSKEGATEEQLLAIEVRATTGKIIASRAQHYLGGGRLGYSTTLGIPLASNKWWFAGGQTAANTIEKLVLYNPAERSQHDRSELAADVFLVLVHRVVGDE